MKLMHSLAVLAATVALPLLAVSAHADAISDAQKIVDATSTPNAPWAGPTSGPKAAGGKTIIYVSTNQNNGGALGAGNGVKEAAAKIGWTFKLIDGKGSVSGQASAMSQAIAAKPDVIVLGGVDAKEQATAVEEAGKQGIVIIGWHSYGHTGKHESLPIFNNITTK